MAAESALIAGEVPLAEFVPVPLDQEIAAAWAPGAAAGRVVHVASVYVVEPFGLGDFSGARQGLCGRARFLEHFEVGMECREVPGHVGSKVFREPIRGAVNFGVAVIFIRNEQRRHFKPNVGFL